jgi:hypothetical protein
MSMLATAALVAVPATVAGSSCPEGFHAHTIGDGDHEHEDHVHVGISMDSLDRNGNGVICVKHVSADGTIHVHVDDSLS